MFRQEVLLTLTQRTAGILLPLFSLPGTPWTGTLGRGARGFADFLARAGCRWWQMLPIGPIDGFHSPYSSVSAFAGETLYLDLDELADQGLLDRADLPAPDREPAPAGGIRKADYETARAARTALRRKAFARYRARQGGEAYRAREEAFYAENRFWLDDYTLFRVLAEKFGTSDWPRWPEEYRDRAPDALGAARREAAEEIALHRFTQLVFDTQWRALKEYCSTRGVMILGDVPIYVGMASADTWSNRGLFRLDAQGRPIRISGAPADAFNPDGQRWDSPLYDWDRLAETGYTWWLRRLGKTLSRFDAVRLDHFIGFYNYYSFPVEKRDRAMPIRPDEPTGGLVPSTPIDPDGGFWTAGPREDFLDTVFAHLPKRAFIAEDLGVMTPGVHALRDHYDLPGMNVLLFTYEGLSGADPDPMESVRPVAVACTGTHDTETVRGWLDDLRAPNPLNPTSYAYIAETFRRHLTDEEKKRTDPGRMTNPAEAAPRDLDLLTRCGVREVLASPAETALVPIQDFLALDNRARINFPGRSDNNWLWRLGEGTLTEELANTIRRELVRADRA